MIRRKFSIVSALSVLIIASSVSAERLSETLLPPTTKAFFSILDYDALLDNFNETQLGHLSNDPVMKPFVEDLRRQFKEKMAEAGRSIGITFDDMKEIYGGEICVAMIQPGGKVGEHAMAMIVDITDHRKETDELLAKVDKNQKAKGGKRRDLIQKIGSDEVKFAIYTKPHPKDGTKTETATYFVHENRLVAVDHQLVAAEIFSRFASTVKPTLAGVEAFTASVERCEKAAAGAPPHVRWFVEPFGFVEVRRAAKAGRISSGTDFLKVLKNQGFDAVQGFGGYVNFNTGEQEILHRTFVYAPPVNGKTGNVAEDKYKLAARMLEFPMTNQLVSQDWVPRELAGYLSFNWKVQNAWKHCASLVDEVIGDEGAFQDIKDSLKFDPNGPKIDVDANLVGKLGNRVTLLTDNVVPVTTKSERMLVAIEALDPKTVQATIDKAMRSDHNAQERIINGQRIWEIIEQQTDVAGPPQVDLPPLGFPIEEDPIEKELEEEKERLFPNKAVTVVHGHLMVASHIELLKSVLQKPGTLETLSRSADYKLVTAEMEKLGAGVDSLRYFVRTDEAYRVTYELLRQGKMPQAETLLGKMLNNMLSSDLDKGEVRKQEIDGAKMPDFRVVRPYLGPAGIYMQTEPDGWFVVGCLITKSGSQPIQRVADERALNSAGASKD